MALNFADLFEHAVDAFADRAAVACGDRQVTYRELEERANRLAHHLAGLRVGPGDHVGLYARNSVEAIETLIAACKLRAAAVNINYRYVENELRYMFADSDLTALVYDRRLAPVVAAAASAAPGLRGLVEIDDGGPAPDTAKTAISTTGYDEAVAAASPERDFPARSGDDVYIIYTGGTTGYPKGVLWRHEDIWRTLAGGMDFVTGEPLPDEWAQSRRGLENGEFVKLCAAPLIHGNAQVAALAGLFSGETIVLLPAFDAREIWHAVQRHQVNVMVIIGDAMARPLVEALLAGDYDVSSLAAVSSSAALFSPAVKDACAKALPDTVITEAIGSTETGFAGISFVSAGDPHRGGPTVMAGPDVVVLDDDNQPAAPGQVGRLARGGHVPLGYYKDPERTATMFAEVNGKRYAVPGDMARVEDDGTVTLLGRGNTCVNTGGEKVFPEEVEAALKSHPDVFDALVIGVPDERLGQWVAALVQPRPGAAPDLVAQGYEAGGHTGEIGSMVLIPEIVDAVGGPDGDGVPVLAAGGIGCGRQIAAALALGAAGVWMGSAWLLTHEYAQLTRAPAVTEALLAATSSDTVRSRIYSGKPARLLKNRWTDAWTEPGAPEPLPMPLQNLLVSEAHQRLMRSGQPDVVPMPAGQIVGRITEVRPVAEVMAALIAETDETLRRLRW